jgi:hypothetical protein
MTTVPNFIPQTNDKPTRAPSTWTGYQGDHKTCFAHATTRLITRVIKVKFSTFFSEDNEESDYYYNTVICGNETMTIFDCILQAGHKSFNNRDLSALLFHYIYNCIKIKFGCDGGHSHTSCKYILNILRQEITSDMIKQKLNYNINKKPYTESDIIMFNLLIQTLVDLFSSIRSQMLTTTFNPKIFISNNLENFTLDIYETNSLILQMPTATIVHTRNSIKSGYHYDNVFDTIKAVILRGYYVILEIAEHAIIISDIDKDDDSLIVKNSWGRGKKDWSLLIDADPSLKYDIIKDNKLQWNILADYKKTPPKKYINDPELIKLIFILPAENLVPKPSDLQIMVQKLANPISRFTAFTKYFFKGKGRKLKLKTKTKTKKEKKKKKKRTYKNNYYLRRR